MGRWSLSTSLVIIVRDTQGRSIRLTSWPPSPTACRTPTPARCGTESARCSCRSANIGHQHCGGGGRHQEAHVEVQEELPRFTLEVQRDGSAAVRRQSMQSSSTSFWELSSRPSCCFSEPEEHPHRRSLFHLHHRHLRSDEAEVHSTPSLCWPWLWRVASSSTTPSWC